MKSSRCLLLGALVAAGAVPSRGVSAEPFATKEVRIDALTFTIPRQLTIERIAAEPLVRWPIVADWDPEGRLVVAESGGVEKPIKEHNEQKLHRLIRLVDSDGDGQFDKRIVAAESLAFPEGVLCIGDSILVSAPPQIWKLTDRDGDGICEQREVWFDGQTITGCANDLHGPYLGRDGWIYWCKGAFANQSHELLGGQRHESSAAHIYRRRLGGGAIEPVMTGGMDNPVEVAFTPRGERFFTSTFLQHPGDGRRDGIAHAIYGGVYGKEHRVIDGHRRTGPLMPIMTHLGPAAPSGLTCLESTSLLEPIGLPAEQRSYLAAAQFNLQKVTLHELRPLGATFETVDHILVKGSRIDFHPTDVIEDADGSLLVIDTGGWYNLCCPSSKLDQQTAAGGIYRISSAQTQATVDPRGRDVDWQAMTDERAVASLADPRPWVRRLARQWCIQSQASVGDALKSCCLDESLLDQPRLEAIWTACQIGDDDAHLSMTAALLSSRPAIRQAAAHGISVQRYRPARQALQELVTQDPDPAVRRAAAEALGRIGDADSIRSLMNAMRTAEDDRVLEHSLLYAMIELNQPQTLLESLSSDQPRELLAALIVLDQIGVLEPSHLEPIFGWLDSENQAIANAARQILKRNPAWAASAITMLDEAFDRESGAVSGAEALAGIAEAWQYEPVFQSWVATRLQSLNDLSPAQRSRLLGIITRIGSDSIPTTWDPLLAHWLRIADRASLMKLSSWIAQWSEARFKSSEIGTVLLSLADDPSRSDSDRLQLLAALPSALMPSAQNRTLIIDRFLDPSSEFHSLATAAMARVSMDAVHGEQLIDLLEQVEPPRLMAVVTAVSRVGDDALDRKLMSRLAAVPAGKTLSSDALRNLYRKRSAAVRQEVERAITAIQQPTEVVAAELESVLAQLPEGDAIRGFELFRSERAACHSCHRIAFVGGNVGPELSHIGATRTRRDLLEAILFPSSRLEQSYQPIRVLTTDGVLYNGMVRSETDRVLELALDATRVLSISKDEIEQRDVSAVSIMPGGLAEILSLNELADLLAFLQSAK